MHRLIRRCGRSLAAAGLLLLAGCGQTGPLYLPPPTPPAPSTPPASPAQPAADNPPPAP